MKKLVSLTLGIFFCYNTASIAQTSYPLKSPEIPYKYRNQSSLNKILDTCKLTYLTNTYGMVTHEPVTEYPPGTPEGTQSFQVGETNIIELIKIDNTRLSWGRISHNPPPYVGGSGTAADFNSWLFTAIIRPNEEFAQQTMQRIIPLARSFDYELNSHILHRPSHVETTLAINASSLPGKSCGDSGWQYDPSGQENCNRRVRIVVNGLPGMQGKVRVRPICN
jgi:hypothetical protein